MPAGTSSSPDSLPILHVIFATSGRPVDVEQLPDGSLLVSDDVAKYGTVYRISYHPPTTCTSANPLASDPDGAHVRLAPTTVTGATAGCAVNLGSWGTPYYRCDICSSSGCCCCCCRSVR